MAAEPAVESFDGVVVGSGFGGSVAACRLAETGRSVLLLERGKPYPPGSFPRAPRPVRDGAFWRPAEGLHGLWEAWSFPGLGALVSSGLGGGSLIYANVALRKDPATFADDERERWPVTYEDLEPWYDAVEAMQGSAPYPSDREPYASTPKTNALLAAAARTGPPPARRARPRRAPPADLGELRAAGRGPGRAAHARSERPPRAPLRLPAVR